MWGTLLASLHIAAALIVSIRVLLRPNLDPPVRVAWILIVEAVPLIGILGYLLFGEVRMQRGERQRRADIRATLTGQWQLGPATVTDPPGFAAPVLAANRAAGGFHAVTGSQVTLLSEDDSAWDELIAAIDAATDHVHLLFYIWLDDTTGTRVARAAEAAARRGVTVRIIVDALGSRSFTRSALWVALNASGAKCHRAGAARYGAFQAVLNRVDLRNHRKIAVVDNALAFTGSRNCADMAFAVKPRFAPWVDILVRVTGPVVRQMQAVFLQDWMTITGDDLGAMLVPPEQDEPPGNAGAMAQVVATGPDLRRESLADCMATLIHGARRTITITTPYYVPDAALDAAIRGAALRGVDVTMILPARNDSTIVRGASEAFYYGLVASGVRLMAFQPGLLHAKIITVDGRLAMIGSANLDRRSFELNYEMNLMLVDDPLIAALDDRQRSYVARATEITRERIESWSVLRRLRNNVMAIASPLL